MISIIVSSISPEQNIVFRQNIQQTIGDTPYELLIHDNRETCWGLCELYNKMARKSRYDTLCFLHEDILFHSENWGKILVDFFQNTPAAGVIGFAGATLKTKAISGWGGYKPITRMSMIQHRRKGAVRVYQENPEQESFSPVAVTDGMALIVRRNVWEQHPFDERTFQGFHLYDLDFSMQIAQQYTNYVCHTIQVEHLSAGSYTETWYRETLKFHAKWQQILPFAIHAYPEAFIRECEDYYEFKHAKLQLRRGWDGNTIASIFKRRLTIKKLNKKLIHYNFRLIDPFAKAIFKRLFKMSKSSR